MTKFSYTATKDGKKVSGITEAASKEQAIATLRQQNLHPLVVKENSDSLLSKFTLPKKKVKLKDLALFTRELATMVSAGVPVNRSLATLQTQTTNKYFKQVIASISKDVEGGMALGDAFAKYPLIFSDVYVNMIRAGESGGILDDILKRIAMQVEQDASMRKKIKSAMTYPAVISIVTVVSFFGIMIFIIPRLNKIIVGLGGKDAELPIYTQIMLSISDFLRANLLFIIIGFIIAIILLRRYIRTPKGKYRFHALLLRLPVINTILIKVAVARFSRTFASLMKSGVTVLDALSVTGAAIGNRVIEEELKEAAKAVKNGKQLSEPLSKSKYFPQIVSQMVAVGEETGKIDEVLVKVADFYEEEVSATIDGLSSIIEPIMIIVLGAIVGVIAMSVMGPIANLSKNIGR